MFRKRQPPFSNSNQIGRILLRLLRLPPVHLSRAMALLPQPLTLVCEFLPLGKILRCAAIDVDEDSRLSEAASVFSQTLGVAAEEATYVYTNASGQEVLSALEDVWRRVMSAFTAKYATNRLRQRYAKSLSVHADSGLVTLTLTVRLARTCVRLASTCQAPAAAAAATGTLVATNRTGGQLGTSEAQVRSLPACSAPGRQSPGRSACLGSLHTCSVESPSCQAAIARHMSVEAGSGTASGNAVGLTCCAHVSGSASPTSLLEAVAWRRPSVHPAFSRVNGCAHRTQFR